MAVLKNLLPAQRHLILVCQNYSVCMKSWPRAPGPQGFRVSREKEIAEEEAAAIWAVGPERFFSYPSTRPSALPFMLQVWVCVRSEQFCPFTVVRSACFVLSGVEKEVPTHSPVGFLFCTVALGGESGAASRLALLRPGLRGPHAPEMLCFLNASISVKLLSFLVNSILT